jgi:ribosomal protein S14
MKYLKKKDLKHRKEFFFNEKLLFILNFTKNFLLLRKSSNYFSIFFYKFIKANRLNSKTKIKTRCVASNRGRGVLKSCSVSRMKLKEFIQLGILPGYQKAVW